MIHPFCDEKAEQLQSMAAELVALAAEVDGRRRAPIYVKSAASTITVVFMNVAHPIRGQARRKYPTSRTRRASPISGASWRPSSSNISEIVPQPSICYFGK